MKKINEAIRVTGNSLNNGTNVKVSPFCSDVKKIDNIRILIPYRIEVRLQKAVASRIEEKMLNNG